MNREEYNRQIDDLRFDGLNKVNIRLNLSDAREIGAILLRSENAALAKRFRASWGRIRSGQLPRDLLMVFISLGWRSYRARCRLSRI